jgi:hypothetical protein
MIGPGAGLMAFRVAAFIVVFSGLLLLIVEPGTAQFVITCFMLAMGLVFAALVFVLVRLKNR